MKYLIALILLALPGYSQTDILQEYWDDLESTHKALVEATAKVEEMQLRLAELMALVAPPVIVEPPIVEPPVIVEPPIIVEPPHVPDEPIAQYLASLPFKVPAFPEYVIPTESDCEWIIQDGVATSTRGLPPITGDYLVGPAYKASIAAGHELPIDIGVWDDAGQAIFAGGWSGPTPYNDRSVFIQNDDGTFADLRCRIVGLDDECEIQVGWEDKWGLAAELGLYNIGLRGQNDSFIIRGINDIGELTMDGCWWLAHKDYAVSGKTHTSGMNIKNWDRLIWRRHQWRGETPTDPGVNLREHSAYLTSADGDTWIVECNLMGGNRTGFQIRPTKDKDVQVQPKGNIIIAKNVGHGYGWNMGDTPPTFDGGSYLSVWSNPWGDTFIVGNTITDAKYGCIMVGGQSAAKNWLNEEGYPIGKVWVWDNVMENAQVGHPEGLPKREAASFTAIEELHFGPQDVTGKVVFNNKWGIETHGIYNGAMFLYDEDILEMGVQTYVDGKTHLMTKEELEALATWQ